MYIVTGKSCSSWYAAAYEGNDEWSEYIHRVVYYDEALQAAWMDAPMASDLEKRIERKGENFALQQLLDEMVERKQISVADALAEMAKFMGGETEAHPEPEPEKPKLAYAKGDVVLIKATIIDVDEDDEASWPYKVQIGGFIEDDWVKASDIAGKASTATDVKEEPKPEPVKYEAGTKVRSKAHPEWGVGEYEHYWKLNDLDEHPHGVYFRGDKTWLADDDIEVVTEEPKTEPKFKVGDKVIHKFKPVWGVGEVLEIHQKIAQYDFFGGDNPEVMPATRAYKVRFSHLDADGYTLSDYWYTAEENLFAA